MAEITAVAIATNWHLRGGALQLAKGLAQFHLTQHPDFEYTWRVAGISEYTSCESCARAFEDDRPKQQTQRQRHAKNRLVRVAQSLARVLSACMSPRVTVACLAMHRDGP
eukprot:9081551-Alexandrium_andersonii.AAC.1